MTEPPIIQILDGLIAASCATAGASIGWTSDPPGTDEAPSRLGGITGDPATGGRAWRLYSAPFAAPAGRTLWFRAQRLGYQASTDVALTIGP